MGVESYWPWGPSVGDMNADGWDDIFIASGMTVPSVGDEFGAAQQPRRKVLGRGVPAGNRATPRWPYAHAAVHLRLLPESWIG